MLDKLSTIINNVELSSKDFLDIRYAQSESETFSVRNGRFDTISNRTSGGIAIRALVDNAWGFTTTVSLETEDILKNVKKAISMARIASKYAKEERRISDKWVFEGKGATEIKIDPRELDKEIKLEKIKIIEKSAREFSDNIAQASSTYQEMHKMEYIVNNKKR